MVFKKKKEMIDMRDLQRRGVLKIPKKEVELETDKRGFLDLRVNSQKDKNERQNTSNFSTETEGYSKREVDSKVIELDNKIYKLEQRIELLERKANVGQNNNSNGLIGW